MKLRQHFGLIYRTNLLSILYSIVFLDNKLRRKYQIEWKHSVKIVFADVIFLSFSLSFGLIPPPHEPFLCNRSNQMHWEEIGISGYIALFDGYVCICMFIFFIVSWNKFFFLRFIANRFSFSPCASNCCFCLFCLFSVS